jgi:hypothetical protein
MSVGQLSTFTSRWYYEHVQWPEWFVEKYREKVWFTEDGKGPIASKWGAKTYWEGLGFADLPEDVRKAINWDAFSNDEYVLVFLHQSNAITRVRISRDLVRYEQPDEWDAVKNHGDYADY